MIFETLVSVDCLLFLASALAVCWCLHLSFSISRFFASETIQGVDRKTGVHLPMAPSHTAFLIRLRLLCLRNNTRFVWFYPPLLNFTLTFFLSLSFSPPRSWFIAVCGRSANRSRMTARCSTTGIELLLYDGRFQLDPPSVWLNEDFVDQRRSFDLISIEAIRLFSFFSINFMTFFIHHQPACLFDADNHEGFLFFFCSSNFELPRKPVVIRELDRRQGRRRAAKHYERTEGEKNGKKKKIGANSDD